MLRTNVLLIFAAFLLFSAALSATLALATLTFTPYSKAFVSAKLRESFFEHNVDANATLHEFKQSLKKFQQKLLKMRNADCLYQNQGRVDMSVINLNEYSSSKSDSRWRELIELWTNFNTTNNESYSVKILNNLNEMVWRPLRFDSIYFYF
jgi:hypothetical protein